MVRSRQLSINCGLDGAQGECNDVTHNSTKGGGWIVPKLDCIIQFDNTITSISSKAHASSPM